MDKLLRDALQTVGADKVIDQTAEDYLVERVAGKYARLSKRSPEQLVRFGLVSEREGLEYYAKLTQLNFTGAGSTDDKTAFDMAQKEFIHHFGKAFFCWRSIFSTTDTKAKKKLEMELNAEKVPLEINIAFRLAVSGLLSHRTAEVRFELERFRYDNKPEDWYQKTITRVFYSFILLTRKARGYEDIDLALKNIALLREEQEKFESQYIESRESEPSQVATALELVGLYHLAQIINQTAEFLQTGKGSSSSLNLKLEKHGDLCREAFATADIVPLIHLASLLQAGCRELIQNSIWTHAALMPLPVRDFVSVLTERGSPSPVLELWPAQQEALNRNLLTTYHRAVLVQMPTSAGKTLLAKFAIVQSIALNDQGTIAYVVPTRALVNQVTFDLRHDFSKLKKPLKVEQATPAFELDPSEDLFLQSVPNVLVTTPEKLDLLIRKDHVVTKNLSMIIADEAHNIRDENRGARLELLLGTIKRDRASARFLLLSPWLPNNTDLLAWLGEQQALDAITVDWRPSNRVVGSVTFEGRGSERAVYFEALPAADNSDIKHEKKFVIAPREFVAQSKSIENITKATVQAMGKRGTVLVLCRGPKTAMTRAQQLATLQKTAKEIPEIAATAKCLELELGAANPLSALLSKRIAFHHAGISHESRWLIEILAKKNCLDVICGTSTLAQGVNFPISTVIVESFDKGDTELTYHDFWNIAGRAGRTLKDSLGVVAFPNRNETDRQECLRYLKGEADEIISQITQLISDADKIGQQFDLKLIAQNPGLSALLQFLAHAMRVADKPELADDVEDILRASLAYYQLRKRDPAMSQKLITLCRNYMLHLQKKTNLKGLLRIADQTGFATPSVLKVLAVSDENRQLKDPSTWHPTKLFGNDIAALSERMAIVGDIPEINLSEGTGRPFSPERIALILRDWVNGMTMSALAERYTVPSKQKTSETDRLIEFSRYMHGRLLGNAAWGLGALESICLAGSEADPGDAGYVASMVFFGVKSKQAVWLRTVGVPRSLADGLSTTWPRNQQPHSFDQIRDWVTGLSDQDWRGAIPAGASLTPADCRTLWKMIGQ